MEEALLKIFQDGLTPRSLLLIVQLILVAFAALWIRGWIKKTWAWSKFKRSTVVRVGTQMTVTINGTTTITGMIVAANKSNVIVQSKGTKAVIKTVKFVDEYDWLIHTPQPKREA